MTSPCTEINWFAQGYSNVYCIRAINFGIEKYLWTTEKYEVDINPMCMYADYADLLTLGVG